MDVKTSVRTLEVFELFARQCKPLTLSEIARMLQAPPSSCFQLLRTLERRGYLYGLGPAKLYYPTQRMFSKAKAIAEHDPVLNVLAPELSRLRDATTETVVLGQLVGDKAMIVETFESPHSVRYAPVPGQLRPIHSSSIGKALLGCMTRKQRDALLAAKALPRFTQATITTRAALERELEASNKRGWYSSLGETVPDLDAVAAPVHFAGRTFAITVAGPSNRCASRRKEHIRELLSTCKRIETLASTNMRGASAVTASRGKAINERPGSGQGVA